MKNLIAVLLFGTLFTVVSCSTESDISNTTDYLNLKENYHLVIEDSEHTFTSQAELLSFIKSSKYSDQYDLFATQFNSMNEERTFIAVNELETKPEDHPDVLSYLKKFEKLEQEKVSPLGFAYPASNCVPGNTLYCGIPKAKLKSKHRNKLSSFKNGTFNPVVYCKKTWFRGDKLVTSFVPNCKNFINTSMPSMNNNAESIF